MTTKQWRPNLAITVIGAVDIDRSCIKGKTTDLPPFRESGITKVEIEDTEGMTRNVAISRIKVGLYV